MKILLYALVSRISSCSTHKRSLSSPLRPSSLSRGVRLPAFACCTATLYDSRHCFKSAYTCIRFAVNEPSFILSQAGPLVSTTLSGTDLSCLKHFTKCSQVSLFPLV